MPPSPIDKRLWREDIAASRAHAAMLGQQGILSAEDAAAIDEGLLQIAAEIEAGQLHEDPALEDIHMHVEHRLAELIGDAAGRLHTARSRNDQVATDFKLFVRSCDRRGDRRASTRSKPRCSTAPRNMRRASCRASPISSRASR